MRNDSGTVGRSLGLFGATSVGVGAIVGGGILALAGVAYSTTGPSAIVAFALNGLIALLTALSFAEMSTAFPESGGTYTFSKKVLSVRTAFTVGWIVWFASMVAAVLYALGFASFAVAVIKEVWRSGHGIPPEWLGGTWSITFLAVFATAVYTLSLVRRSGGGGEWVNVSKVLVFGVLVLGGFWALSGEPISQISGDLSPFFAAGAAGLFQAMGYTFIALQGFDLIAAVAGEVENPDRNIPRAMLISLGTALVIYLPLLFIVATAGTGQGQSIVKLSAGNQETIIAIAAENYLGVFGYWLVMVAALLSMLSALQANLFAASRVALSMARDRTLPRRLSIVDKERSIPVLAVIATSLIVGLILLIVPDVAAAGAAASLIFLISFAAVHIIVILARLRTDDRTQNTFRTPWFPVVPVLGVLSCVALAVFQGVSVPLAGVIVVVWLAAGGFLYISLFARRAKILDASAEALDPQLLKLRGRSPLVLVPIANPSNAEAMVFVANALAPPDIGSVLLLSVVTPPREWEPGETPRQLVDAQSVLRESLTASFAADLSPEALTTVAEDPWDEIRRVALSRRCESLLLGLTNFGEDGIGTELEELISTVNSDVVILRAPHGWRIPEVKKVLVPVGGQGEQSVLRARILGSLRRIGTYDITYLCILPENASARSVEKTRRSLTRLAQDEVPGDFHIQVVRSESVAEEIVRYSMQTDLVILGLRRLSRRRKVFGDLTLRVARETTCPLIMISRHG